MRRAAAARQRALGILRTHPWAFAAWVATVLLVVNLLVEPGFGDPDNWPNQLATLAPLAFVALASTPSVLSGGGGLDLSIGPLTCLLNVVLVVWLLPADLVGGPVLGTAIVLAAGAALGALNGVLVTVLRFQPVIATLCAFFFFAGLAEQIAGTPETAPANWTADLAGSIGPLPGALLLLAVPVAVWALLRWLPYVTALYSVGGDDATAFTAGVDVTRTRIVAYALGGLFAGLGAIALTALLQTANAALGVQYTLIALAAVALGGTPIGGGRGGLLGSFLGAVVIYLLQTLLSALEVPVTWLEVMYGAMVAIGVILGSQLIKPAQGTRA